MGSNDVSGFSTFARETEGREADWASPPQTTGEGGGSDPAFARGGAALAALGPRPASAGAQGPAQAAAARAPLSVKCKAPSAPAVLASADNASKGTAGARPAATRAEQNAALRAAIFQQWRTANRREVFPITDPDGPPTMAMLQDYPGKPGAYLVVNPNGGPARFTAMPRDDGKLIGAPLMKAGAYDEHGAYIPGTDSRFPFQDADAYGSPSEYLVTQRDKDISDCEKFDEKHHLTVNARGIGKCTYREFESLYGRYTVRSIDTDTDLPDVEYPYVTIKTGREALSTEGVATCHSITLYGVNERGKSS